MTGSLVLPYKINAADHHIAVIRNINRNEMVEPDTSLFLEKYVAFIFNPITDKQFIMYVIHTLSVNGGESF